ncbi:MAG: ankyrin repeat domain-containing protein [Xanthobacteraceae bacterium]
MAEPLPARANLEWLRKTAKQHLRFLRLAQPEAKLAQAQLAIARQYGFSSWRSLKAHADDRGHGNPAKPLPTDENIAAFLRAVGEGRLSDVRAVLAGEPGIVNAVGPHPFWGGRPQALHVSIETKRRDVFDLLIDAGADIDGSNELYEHWSPLMLTFHWDQPIMRGVLLAKGARIGLVEAMLFEDDAAVAAMLGRGKRALPNIAPNGGSLLAFARTPFAIDRLLELGVAVHQKDRWNTAPMQAMSRLGPRGQDLVRHLMQRGLKAEPEDFARLGDKAALAALIDRDPSVARADTVIMSAVDFGHHELVRWLLSQGANVNARAAWGSQGTALHSAAWNGDLEMVKLLVAAGADVSARDAEHGNTPAGFAQVAITVSNNLKCKEVVDYLERLSPPDRPASRNEGHAG